MEVLLLLVTALGLAGLGFRLMHRMDCFARSGGFHPYWDEAAEASCAAPPSDAAPLCPIEPDIAC